MLNPKRVLDVTTKSRIKKYGIFFVLFCLTLWLRWPYVFVDRLWPDEALYAWSAQRIHAHASLMFSKEFVRFHPPGFPAYLALWHSFFPPEIASRLGTVILNCFAVTAVYLVGLRTYGVFVGLLSSLALAFNPIHISQSEHILLDAPLMTMVIFLVALLSRLDEKKSQGYHASVGLLASLIILIKWSGVLVVPLTVIFYLGSLRAISLEKRWRKLTIPLLVMGATLLLLLTNNWWQLGKILPDASALHGKYLVRPFWYYVVNIYNLLICPVFVPFFFVGLISICRMKTRSDLLVLIWFAVFFVPLSLTPEKNLRYGLLILPSLLVISSLGIHKTLQSFLRNKATVLIFKGLCIIGLVSFFLILLPRTKGFLMRDGRQFAGFREAGVWIKENVPDDAIILTGSLRSIRYYSGINYAEFGGRIIPLPREWRDLKRVIEEKKTPVYIVLDYWEGTQPPWIYPYPQTAKDRLRSLGFNVEKTIQRKITKNNRQQDEEVVTILKKS